MSKQTTKPGMKRCKQCKQDKPEAAFLQIKKPG